MNLRVSDLKLVWEERSGVEVTQCLLEAFLHDSTIPNFIPGAGSYEECPTHRSNQGGLAALRAPWEASMVKSLHNLPVLFSGSRTIKMWVKEEIKSKGQVFQTRKITIAEFFFLMLNTEIGKNKTFNPGLVTNKSESLSFSALFPCL